jgi:hypothetical protein
LRVVDVVVTVVASGSTVVLVVEVVVVAAQSVKTAEAPVAEIPLEFVAKMLKYVLPPVAAFACGMVKLYVRLLGTSPRYRPPGIIAEVVPSHTAKCVASARSASSVGVHFKSPPICPDIGFVSVNVTSLIGTASGATVVTSTRGNLTASELEAVFPL